MDITIKRLLVPTLSASGEQRKPHQIAYTDWGNPSNPNVIVCVHGLTRNCRDFDFLAQTLQAEFRVISVDVVGRGQSDWLEHAQDYDFYPLYLSDALAQGAGRDETLPIWQDLMQAVERAIDHAASVFTTRDVDQKARAAAACGRSERGQQAAEQASAPAAAADAPAGHATLAPAASAPGLPLYDLHLPLTDQTGAAIGVDVFRGHPVVISMFYSSCPYACPTLIADVQRLLAHLPAAQRAAVRVLLVSFDPERDTTGRLAELSRKHRLDPQVVKLARGEPDAVRELAAVLGIKYRKLAGGDFDHSSVITVVDAEGRITGSREGLGRGTEDLVALVEPALRR